ncbi:MAG: phospholipid carrier-dependent glycosyltransferase [Candidatus Andersenbacteria bacterium]
MRMTLIQRVSILVGLFAAIFVPRIITLGTIFTIDERLWLARGAKFMEAFASLHMADTRVAFQPGVTTTWLSAVTTHFNSLAASQASIAVATGLLIAVATYFLVRVLAWRWGVITGFILALDPFLIAHSRVVHTDALLALLLLTAVLGLCVARKEGGSNGYETRYLVFSAILAGLAVTTKIFALFALGPIALIVAWDVWQKTHRVKQVGSTVGFWVVIAVATAFAVWPALWVDALGVLDYLWSNISGYSSSSNRRLGETSTQWWYYMREGPMRLTAAISILFVVSVATFWREKRTHVRFMLFTLLASGLVYALCLHASNDRADRYLLFLLLTVDIWAVMGLRQLVILLKRFITPQVGLVLAALPILLLAITDFRLHPYYLSHYNRLLPFHERQKLGWGEGLEEAAKYIAARDPQASVVAFYSSVFEYSWNKFGGTGYVTSLEHMSDDTDYVVIYRSMFERAPDSVESDFTKRYLDDPERVPVHVVTVNKLPYVWIFQEPSL